MTSGAPPGPAVLGPESGRTAVLVHGRGSGPETMLDLAGRLAAGGVRCVLPAAAGNTWYPQRFKAPLADNEPWLTYALGSENQNLPGYIVLCPGRPVVGPQLWSNSFLPAEFQATSVITSPLSSTDGIPAADKLVANIQNPKIARMP